MINQATITGIVTIKDGSLLIIESNGELLKVLLFGVHASMEVKKGTVAYVQGQIKSDGIIHAQSFVPICFF